MSSCCVQCKIGTAAFCTPDNRRVCSTQCAAQLLGMPIEKIGIQQTDAIGFGRHRGSVYPTPKEFRKVQLMARELFVALTDNGGRQAIDPNGAGRHLFMMVSRNGVAYQESFYANFVPNLLVSLDAVRPPLTPTPMPQRPLWRVDAHRTSQVLIQLRERWFRVAQSPQMLADFTNAFVRIDPANAARMIEMIFAILKSTERALPPRFVSASSSLPLVSQEQIGVLLEDQITQMEKKIVTLQKRVETLDETTEEAWRDLETKKANRDQQYEQYVKPLDAQTDVARNQWSVLAKDKQAANSELFRLQSKLQTLRGQVKPRPGSAAAAAAKPAAAAPAMAVDKPSAAKSSSNSSNVSSSDSNSKKAWLASARSRMLPALYRARLSALAPVSSKVVNDIRTTKKYQDGVLVDVSWFHENYQVFLYAIDLYWKLVTDAKADEIKQPDFSPRNAYAILFAPLRDDTPQSERAIACQEAVRKLVSNQAYELFHNELENVVTFNQTPLNPDPFAICVKKLMDKLKTFGTRDKVVIVLMDVLFMVVACYICDHTEDDEAAMKLIEETHVYVPEQNEDEPINHDDDGDDDDASSDSFVEGGERLKFWESAQGESVKMLQTASIPVLTDIANRATELMIMDSASSLPERKLPGKIMSQAMIYLSHLRDHEPFSELFPPEGFTPADAQRILFHPLDEDNYDPAEGSREEAVQEHISDYRHSSQRLTRFFHVQFKQLMLFNEGATATQKFQGMITLLDSKMGVDRVDIYNGAIYFVVALYIANHLDKARVATIKAVLTQEKAGASSSAAAAAASQ